jgi:8-oxo-dGTP pyrophosphatase MutT (NUDIX family)
MLFTMELSALYDPERFRKHVMNTLARAPLDYLEQLEFIRQQKNSPTPWESAGVLLPLYFLEEEKLGKDRTGQYVVLLNKRSKRVQQAGDLCAPGGGVHPVLDGISQQILRTGLFPWSKGLAFEQGKRRGAAVYKKILFFLGNALRESWEEIHLSPFNVEFLGPLPSYRLQSRRWVIFPVVGRVKRPWQAKLSPEVDKIIPIPLHTFFLPESYASYSLEVPEELVAQGIPNPWEFPCLVYDAEGEEEILWGATYAVVRSFLGILFDQPLPSPDGRRVIQKKLLANYLSGKEEG